MLFRVSAIILTGLSFHQEELIDELYSLFQSILLPEPKSINL
jgi:hypothetical protein